MQWCAWVCVYVCLMQENEMEKENYGGVDIVIIPEEISLIYMVM